MTLYIYICIYIYLYIYIYIYIYIPIYIYMCICTHLQQWHLLVHGSSSSEMVKSSSSASLVGSSSTSTYFGRMASQNMDAYCEEEESRIVSMWKENELAMFLTQDEWKAISVGIAKGVVRPFQPTFPVILAMVPQTICAEAYDAVGVLEFEEEVIDVCVQKSGSWLESQVGKVVADAMVRSETSRKKSFFWRFKDIFTFEEPMKNVDFSKKRGPSRLIHISYEQACRPRSPPKSADLGETAKFFLSKLPEPQRKAAFELGEKLSGGASEIRVGTTCSGTDICISVLRATLDHISQA